MKVTLHIHFFSLVFLCQTEILSAKSIDQHLSISDSKRRKKNYFKKGINSSLKEIRNVQKMNSQEKRSIILMTIAMSFHYLGYEIIRNSSMSLFTSPSINLPKIAHPLAMSGLSFVSGGALLIYSKILSLYGPRIALRYTSLACLGIWITFGVLLLNLRHVDCSVLTSVNEFSYSQILKRCRQSVAVFSFLLQHTYVYLLSTQYWSFIGSIFTSSGSSSATIWFSAISGASLVTSTIASSSVSLLLSYFPLESLLIIAGGVVALSLIFSELAFHSCTVTELSQESQKKTTSTKSSASFQTAIELFQRVPILKALFYEEFLFQALASITNVMFVTQLKSSSTNLSDVAKASWTGYYFSLINGISAILQFLVLPLFLTDQNSIAVRKYLLPMISFVCSACLFFEKNVSQEFILVAASLPFFFVKLTDYSIRGILNQMVYLPLDYESRYLGKEIIGVLASRFGKSGISLFLSLLTFLFSFHTCSMSAILPFLSCLVALCWASCSFQLANLQKSFNSNNKKDD